VKLAVLAPLLFYVWTWVQPAYSAAVAGATNALLAAEERGERVTTLTPAGSVIAVWSTLRDDGQPAGSYDADILHFYLVLCVALVLALPEPRGWRRAGALAATAGVLFVFHAVALLVTVEHTYAVTLVKVAERNYTPGEAAVYKWLKETFVYFAVQLVPALTLLAIVTRYGGFGRALGSLRSAPADAPEAAPAEASARRRRRWPIWAAAALPVLAVAGALYVHEGKVEARQAESLCFKGYADLTANRFALAQDKFRGALERNPSFLEAHAGLGHALLKEGNPGQAEKSFREAAALDPNNLAALLGVASCQSALGRLEEALASYRSAAGRHPESWEAHFNLGLTLSKLGRPQEAEPEQAKAVEMNPGLPDAHLELAKTLRKLGRECEALPQLEEFLSLEPDSSIAQAVREVVEGTRPACEGSGS